jgi:hypothetical protein
MPPPPPYLAGLLPHASLRLRAPCRGRSWSGDEGDVLGDGGRCSRREAVGCLVVVVVVAMVGGGVGWGGGEGGGSGREKITVIGVTSRCMYPCGCNMK